MINYSLNAQNSAEKAGLYTLPTRLLFADLNKDNIISDKEIKHVFDSYINNPSKNLKNDLLDDVEAELIALIAFSEGKDYYELKKSNNPKVTIEVYYKNRFAISTEKKNDTIKGADTSLIVKEAFDLEQAKSDIRFLLELEKFRIEHHKSDSTINSLVNQIEQNIKISGLIDTYYSYDLNKPANSSLIGSNGAGRVFDRYHNRLSLSMAQTKFEYSAKSLKALVDLAYGLGGEIANYGNNGTSLIIKQVYLSYDPFKKATITVGNFATPIGYEVIEASNNFNYSVSNLFTNGPFYHTGIKMDLTLSEKIKLMGGIVSGWDKISDDNKAKTFMSQVSLTPNDKSFLILNWIGGNEAPSSLTGDTIKVFKQMLDLSYETGLTKKIRVALNAAYGLNNFDGKKNTWGGAALYLKYKINSMLTIGSRTEFFDDSQKVQYLGCSYLGQTMTLAIEPLKNIAIKLEFKKDFASLPVYYKGRDNELSKNQTTLGIAIIGKF
ncbi:porin [Aurantibacillus circumpalustris]|uniref:porin n=1 Tax=Aurantibacillus circumpalustris TaxID=3036359 RepID=UPI00295A6C38|nr:porin [Aurantibacillus circumpalustris]